MLQQRFVPSATLALAAMLAGCAQPTIQTGEGADTVGNLNKVDNARVAMAYVDPDADYTRYSRIYISPLDMDNVEIIQPDRSSGMVNRYNREWELTDVDKQRFQAAFRDVMERELSKDGAYGIADGGADDVLVVVGQVTQIAPSAPKDDFDSRTTGRSRVYTEGAGSISIAIAFEDGDSGEVLAIIKDRRNSNSSNWGLNNSVTNMSEVRRAFSSWAIRVREGLADLRMRAESS